jgi:putative colanic acid biosynthesis glycosyltransferase
VEDLVPKFSIITVCYNDAIALASTIRSVGTQRFADFEYIVQDGGSTDLTGDIVRSFGDWIDVFHSEKDNGLYHAMNRAVQFASGDYILFLGAGDIFAANTTLSQFATLMNDRDEIVYGAAQSMESGKIAAFKPRNMFWTGHTFDHQSCTVRRSLLLEFPFDERFAIGADLDFFTRCRLARKRFRSIDLTVVIKPYSVGKSSDFFARFGDRYAILSKAFGEKYPVETTLRRELIDEVARRIGFAELKESLDSFSVEEILSYYDRVKAL